jgi:16S rRNA (guanine(966)-N(2))-methyltransferase RsmD
MQRRTPAKSAERPLTRKGQPHQVRIIGGQWKRTLLPVLDAEGLRPTPDRVRETLFNWLTHLFDGSWNEVACLDLFAGTGALGFEAASRGAVRVVMVEANAQAIRQLQAIKDKLHAEQVNVVRGDALAVAQNLHSHHAGLSSGFRLIFLDPPYHQDWLPRALPICAKLLVSGGLLYAESEIPLDIDSPPEWLSGWEVIRADKAGMVFYHLLQRKIAG